MLQVHPDSTCDICLDQYVFSNPAKIPHAIACGHIFCLECLAQLNHPTSCPLCRTAFGIDRVNKLHVDRHVLGEREAAMPGAWSLVQRLARCAHSEVDIQPTEELIREGQRWLGNDNHKELFPEVDSLVDAVFSALSKYKSLQERFHDQQATIGSLTNRLHREEAMKDEERKAALVEGDLIRKIKELESQLVYYEGARYEDRVEPQAVRDITARDPCSERERARSIYGHKDHSNEKKSRRREGESEWDRHRRRREPHRCDAAGRATVAASTIGSDSAGASGRGSHLELHVLGGAELDRKLVFKQAAVVGKPNTSFEHKPPPLPPRKTPPLLPPHSPPSPHSEPPPPPPPAKVHRLTTAIMQKSLQASKAAREAKRLEAQREQERVLQVLKSSSRGISPPKRSSQ